MKIHVRSVSYYLSQDPVVVVVIVFVALLLIIVMFLTRLVCKQESPPPPLSLCVRVCVCMRAHVVYAWSCMCVCVVYFVIQAFQLLFSCHFSLTLKSLYVKMILCFVRDTVKEGMRACPSSFLCAVFELIYVGLKRKY